MLDGMHRKLQQYQARLSVAETQVAAALDLLAIADCWVVFLGAQHINKVFEQVG